MIGFNISRDKLLQMPPPRRHKWLARWFAELYVQLTALQAQPVTPQALALLAQDYRRALGWMDCPAPPTPQGPLRAWQEWASDRFHHHQQETGLGLGEEGYLVPQGDLESNEPWQPRFDYWVAAEKIRSAFNLGSLIRSAEALGLAGLLIGPDCPPVSHNQVRKTAMGAEAWFPCLQPPDFWDHVESLSAQGYALIGVERTAASLDYRQYPWPNRAVLLLGNEEFGLSQRALSAVVGQVHLPMRGRKNSVNVASAFAALGFHLTSALEARHA
ncbi:MAG: TrmH family RNA methyltransferase [bacterium]|nr:TrmH family RNA methyltransferase [bacterium]